ncbi:nitrilase family protein [Aeoliella sp. ICT_H6.2]|uniref:Nitrilase family protein n=1 Tax=Aeoliella straminimaris TaxID=2954799 RepID=A0A9X2JFL8_9BACT|nr:nitrilase family protein [Aeoliella straminimaris]MCO6043437.1 nitrilase family protein [Aeoliella straminimaris]
MRDIRIATVQFENRDNDPPFNLGRIRELTGRAAEEGAEIVSFHECCIPAYTWLQPLDKNDLLAVAEPVPDGRSVKQLIDVAREFRVVVMAGLLERTPDQQVYNTYVTVGPEGFIAKYRKLHPFVNPHLSAGSEYVVIDLLGCKVGFSICYDNNLPENVRITALMGAEIVFMPHVTCCLPSVMPGRGTVPRELWDNRHADPVRLRQEFRGPKGREWLMRWLPARAWENGIYAVFSNPIGWDYDTVKPGLAMILDPFGEVLTESHALEDDVVIGTLTADKLSLASGHRYRGARRPELYEKLVEPQESVTLPGWSMERK